MTKPPRGWEANATIIHLSTEGVTYVKECSRCQHQKMMDKPLAKAKNHLRMTDLHGFDENQPMGN